jgi:hypothetical protein
MKFTIEGNEQDLQGLIKDKAELMLLRAAIAGDAHRPVDIQRAMQSALNMQSQQALSPAPTHLALPSATPPTAYELSPAHYQQQGHYSQPATQLAGQPIDVHSLPLPAATPPKRKGFQLRATKRQASALMGVTAILGATFGLVVFDMAHQAGFTNYDIMPSALKSEPTEPSAEPEATAEPNPDLEPVPTSEEPPVTPAEGREGLTDIEQQIQQYLDTPVAE